MVKIVDENKNIHTTTDKKILKLFMYHMYGRKVTWQVYLIYLIFTMDNQ